MRLSKAILENQLALVIDAEGRPPATAWEPGSLSLMRYPQRRGASIYYLNEVNNEEKLVRVNKTGYFAREMYIYLQGRLDARILTS